MKIQLCPCCSGSMYESCCKSYHEGEEPPHALLLMRSRYAAYALGLPEYIIRTTHPLNKQFQENKKVWKEEILLFCRETNFVKLEILHAEEREETGLVVFTAYLKHKGRDATFTERSNFEKLGGCWRYLEGKISEGALC